MKRHIDCHSCGHDGFVDEPLNVCPECDSGNVKRCLVVECCDEDLYCPGFTNTCPHCSADYNSAGQLLAPREQWCEETTETLDEILSIDNTSTEELLGD